MIRRVRIIFLLTASLLILTGALAAQHTNANTDVKFDFEQEPVKFMAEIYSCYHNWKIDRGIRMAREAIAIVDGLYVKDKNAIIHDPGLKLNKAYQIKSTLHTLAGMLYFRKSLETLRKGDKKESAFIMEKLKKGEKVTEKDFEALAQKIEKNGGDQNSRFLARAREQLNLAIKTDPANPASHFQLAGVYKSMGGDDASASAEKHYFSAARLSLEEGDARAVARAMESLKSLNPASIYIKQFEALQKKGAVNE
jgi:hypothetical protein